ncbi:MAG: exosortase W [Desulfobacterales bacterium]|nr:exosortase W [Desulfobacterales bacterium]
MDTVSIKKSGWLSISHFLLLLVFFALYYKVLYATIIGWFNYNGGHGLLIFLISIYIIWTRWIILRQTTLSPQVFVGASIMTCGCMLLILGDFSSILLLQQTSLIVTLLGMVTILLGFNHLKLLLLPVIYLIFMFPLFEEILGFFVVYFQAMGTFISTFFLKLFGMPVYNDKFHIVMPHITLEIAKVCSGINHITALVSLSIPLSYITQKKIGMLILILITFVVGVVSNGLRIALIGVWTQYAGASTIHGPFSLLYASTVFLSVFALLTFFSMLTGRSHIKETISKYRKKEIVDTRALSPFCSKFISFNIATVILCIAWGYLVLMQPVPVDLKKLYTVPFEIGQWKGENVEKLNERFEGEPSDHQLKKIYSDKSGNKIKLYVDFYAAQTQDREIVNSRSDWLHDRAEIVRIETDKKKIKIKKTKYFVQGKWKTAFFWYDINGNTFVERHTAKVATMLNAFKSRRTDGAIVIISFVDDDQTDKNQFQENVKGFVAEVYLHLSDIFQNR